jgi:hypothetical protein
MFNKHKKKYIDMLTKKYSDKELNEMLLNILKLDKEQIKFLSKLFETEIVFFKKTGITKNIKTEIESLTKKIPINKKLRNISFQLPCSTTYAGFLRALESGTSTIMLVEINNEKKILIGKNKYGKENNKNGFNDLLLDPFSAKMDIY